MVKRLWCILAVFAIAAGCSGVAVAAERSAVPDPASWPLERLRGREAPRMLLFSPIKPAYLGDHAAQWAGWGFRGFLFSAGATDADIWAKDGDPETRGEADAFFRDVRECNRKCRALGIDSNFLKISFSRHLPDWFDDVAWAGLTRRWRQLAVFARDSGCAGVAQDWEYIGEQYHFDFEGYDLTRYTRQELRAKVTERFRQAIGAMLDAYPQMVFLTLPETVTIQGDLSIDMYQGVLEAMARRGAPGGMHLMVERTYHERDPVWVITYVQRMRSVMERVLRGRARDYWRAHGTVVEGAWPLGYYRNIYDAEGEFLGYSGKKETFGDRVVGSYADKSENYPIAEFRAQVAAMRMACPRYTWVYAHGRTWWQYSDAEMKRYRGDAGDAAPTVANLDQYRQIVATPEVIANPTLARVAALIREGRAEQVADLLGMAGDWWIIGPFSNAGGKGLEKSYPPERETKLDATYEGLDGRVRWFRHRTADPLHIVNLGSLIAYDQQTVAYALCTVHAERTVRGQLRASSNDQAVAWLDGKKIWTRDRPRHLPGIDDDVVPLTIPKGTHRLLVKVCNEGAAWEFCLRFTDEWGLPLPGVRCTAEATAP